MQWFRRHHNKPPIGPFTGNSPTLKHFDLGLNLLAGVIIGFMFNIVRIVIIVLLAPSMMEHYHLMHEIIGGITYWACLILVWLALNGPTEPEKASS